MGLGEIVNRKAIATSEKELIKFSEGKAQSPMKMPEARADLVKLSGQVGLNKPYRAPIYRTYWECIKGLYKQGLLAFYKGNGLRLAHGYLYLTLVNQMHNDYLDGDDVLNTSPNYGKTMCAGAFASVSLHFLHVAETRFVL